MLPWPNTSHFMPWQDCSRYSFCAGERAEDYVCVCARERECVGAQAGRLAIVCLSVCREAKCKMIATGGKGERGNRCGGILKASGEAHTRINTTPPRTLPISSGLLCSCDRRDAYYIFASVFVCTCGKTNAIPFGELLTALVLLTSIVKCQHSVFIPVICVFRV